MQKSAMLFVSWVIAFRLVLDLLTERDMMGEGPPISILVVALDDHAGEVAAAVQPIGGTLIHASSAVAALERSAESSPSLIVIDDRIDDLPTPMLIRHLHSAVEASPIVVFAAGDSPEARRAGAVEVIDRHARQDRLRAAVAAVLERVRCAASHGTERVFAERIKFAQTYRSLFRRGLNTRELERNVVQAADSDVPVLITGEAGTGKKSIARALHYLSTRALRPLFYIASSTVPPDLLEPELFGVVGPPRAGSGSPPGRVQEADGGTLVLEEIGELPLAVQQRIVTLIDAGVVAHGDAGPVDVDVRVIATSSKGVDELMRAGGLSDALYHRLGVTTLFVPPLRERSEDIAGLAEFFRTTFMAQFRRDSEPLSEVMVSRLVDYTWPGNVSELENLVKRYVALGDEQQLLAELGTRAQVSAVRRPRQSGDAQGGLRDIGRRAAQEAEMTAILAALEQVNWNRAEAARMLKVSYKTLLNKLSRAGISGRMRGLPGIVER